MLMNKKKPQNIAGLMGRDAVQPAALPGLSTVDPLERMMQKSAGRSQGRILEGIKVKRPSLMGSYGKK